MHSRPSRFKHLFLPLLAAGAASVWHGAGSGQPSESLYLHSAIYDPVRQRMIVFGGVPASGQMSDQTWQLSLAADPQWSLLATTGTPPPKRVLHTAIYDPVRDRMIVFGKKQVGRRVEGWKAKSGYKVCTPDSLGKTYIGDTIANDPESVIGRIMQTTLGEIINDYSHGRM